MDTESWAHNSLAPKLSLKSVKNFLIYWPQSSVEFDILADFERNVTFLLMFKILFILQIQHVYMTDFWLVKQK